MDDRAARTRRPGSLQSISERRDVGGFRPEKMPNSEPPVHLVRLLNGGDGEDPNYLLIIIDPIEDGIGPSNMEAIELLIAREMERLPVAAAASWEGIVCERKTSISNKPPALLRQRSEKLQGLLLDQQMVCQIRSSTKLPSLSILSISRKSRRFFSCSIISARRPAKVSPGLLRSDRFSQTSRVTGILLSAASPM